ncbi:unnamed protein product [Hyaloperonospora brassicae]|uniref:FYVE-type domain-containing protein n=1 Tax=Hyaloperonospora brassicae TaxID=162125 RepID=A0AAV0TVQ2_HYABA|nr:unnamed protein product [Hyaloperonospora brassicae]
MSHHRFPLRETVFPPLHLSEATKAHFVDRALKQLTEALQDYDRYQQWQATRPPSLRYQLHPAMWKPLKSCEQLTVYRRVASDEAVVAAPSIVETRRRARSRTLEDVSVPTTSSSVAMTAATSDSVSSAPANGSVPTVTSWSRCPERSPGATTSTTEWALPTLLQVGTIEGTLDDVMYGATCFDAAGALIRSAYTDEEVVDADTLHEFQGPTVDDPFRFLGLKWLVRSAPSTVKAFVWPRDLTFIAATGVLTRPGGDRVGYQVMRSVDLGKGFGPLEHQRIIRARVSACYLYRQTSANTVDVHMKTNFEPSGSAHESIALMFAVNSLTSCFKSAICAQNKKLSWLLGHPAIAEKADAGAAMPGKKKQRVDCRVCSRPIGPFSRGASCRVCHARACTTCYVKKKLSFSGSGHKTIEHHAIVICTHCLTFARQLASLDIARQEVAERERLGRRRGLLCRATAASMRRGLRCRSNSRVNTGKQLLSSRRKGREISRADVGRVVGAAPRRGTSWSPRRTRSQRKETSSPRAVSDDNADTDDEDDDDDKGGDATHCVPDQPRRKAQSTPSDCSQVPRAGTRAVHETDDDDAASPVMADRALHADALDDCWHVVGWRPTAMATGVPILGDALPEAAEQYAWGAAVPSPITCPRVEPQAAWPSPPSLLLSPSVALLAQTEASRRMARDGRCGGRTPHMPLPAIPRIKSGASVQEVLAQFAELCHAADAVYWAARNHAGNPLEPTVCPRGRISRLDMSAVD